MTSRHPDRASARRGVFVPLQPLSRRIPLMMTGVLAVVVAAMLWLGSSVVVDSVVNAELMRLQAASDQLKSTLTLQTRGLQRDNDRIAALPEIVRGVSPLASTLDRAAARRVIAAERSTQLQNRQATSSIAIWSNQGELVAVDGLPTIAE